MHNDGSTNKTVLFDLFVSQATNYFDDQYSYHLVNYINDGTKVIIFCNKHQLIFEQYPTHHRRGTVGCPSCRNDRRKIVLQEKKLTAFDNFLKESYNIHNEKYDYSLVDYQRHNIKVKIICPIHGIFEQRPHDHKGGQGCPKCAINKNSGENHYNYDHTKTDEERKIQLREKEIKHWSILIKERDDYTCQKCLMRGGRLNSHHLHGVASHPDQACDIDNGITLCVKCHSQFHQKYGYKYFTKEMFLEWIN